MVSSLTAAAQRSHKTRGPHEDHHPAYHILIGSQDVTDALESASVKYQAGEDSSDGTSEADINVFTSLEQHINAPVKIFAGYGDNLAEIFTGRLAETEDDHYGESSSGVAWGVFKQLTSQQFLEQVSYTGSYLERALYDIHSRASIPRGSIEVVSGRSLQIGADEEATFAPEVPFADAVKSLCESAGFVGFDLPGSRRKYQPKPRSTSSSGQIIYNESHYPPGGFTAKRNPARTFAKTMIFRREEDGADAFPPVIRSIDVETKYKPAPNSAYIVPEFLGSFSDAQNEAARLARMLAAGEYEISLEGIALNPDLGLYDQLETETTELRDEGGRTKERYLTRYSWVISGENTMEIDEGLSQSLSGTGIKVSETRLAKPFPVAPKRGYGLPTHRSPTPSYARDHRGFFVGEASTTPPWFGVEDGFYIVPEYSEGRTDVDSDGWFLVGVRRG